MGNSTTAPKQQSFRKKSSSRSVLPQKKSTIDDVKLDQIDDAELNALKDVCISYIDMIEFVIDSIPEKKENEPEPDFESVFLQLKTFVTNAKMQLGRQEIDNLKKEERTLKIKTQQLTVTLPDLPYEEPNTPSIITHTNTYSALSGSPPEISSTFVDLASPSVNHASHAFSDSMDRQSLFKKFTTRNLLLDDESSTISKIERERIKSEIKSMKKQIKTRKFEVLADNIWEDYLLQYLCHSEQFVLASTCTYCEKKCGLHSFIFANHFESDNFYWRNNFWNLVDSEQDSTLLLNENKFELMTLTQRCQLKYFIRFWDKFVSERKQRKERYYMEHKAKDIERNLDENVSENDKENEIEYKEDEKVEENEKQINIKMENEEDDDDEDVLDLYAEDNFEYDDDRPRGQVLLEKYRQDYDFINEMAQDAMLKIVIPCDVEQLIINDCKNRNGELAQWLSSLLCHLPINCPIDWLGLDNNNLQDRDIMRICAGLLNRKTQCNLIGISLRNNSYITDKCIAVLLDTISKKCHNLQFLMLSKCTKLTNKTCQHIVDFFEKTYSDFAIQLNHIDLGDNYKINDKGIIILNQIYTKCAPFNETVTFYAAGTHWIQAMGDWSKNIILKPPKRR